jgi:hypothetical protein
LITAGYWSTYWYNGFIYGTEIARGVDVFRLMPSDYLTKNEIEAATLATAKEFNAQDQTRVSWPASSVVARAYLDQLTRGKAIQPGRVRAVNAALDQIDRLRTGGDRGAANARGRLTSLAAQLEKDGAAATGRDAARLQALATTLKGRAAALR